MTSGKHIYLTLAFVAFFTWGICTSTPAAVVTWNGSGDMNWDEPDTNSWDATYNSTDDARFAGSGQGTVTIAAGGVTPKFRGIQRRQLHLRWGCHRGCGDPDEIGYRHVDPRGWEQQPTVGERPGPP